MLRKLRLLQHSYTSHYSIYIIENFLEDELLEKVLKKCEELTESDTMNKSTNVKATMTDYQELLKHDLFKKVFQSVIEYLHMFFLLRATGLSDKMKFTVHDAWAMRHKKDDYTKMHTHHINGWAGALFLKVPGPSHMTFPDFDAIESIQSNSLYLFPGLTKHSVLPQQYEEHRISIGFNIIHEQ